MDAKTWRALRLAVEAEEAFGIDLMAKGPHVPEKSSQEPPLAAPVKVSVKVPNAAVSTAQPSPLTSVNTPSSSLPQTEPVFSDTSSQGRSLEQIAAAIASCEACSLCESRTKTVPGQGGSKARLMFIGEAPGYHEDQEGLAFVGAAGQLLTKMIGAMGLQREEVFIANVLKCRPPNNRDPLPEEAQACFHFLADQIDAINPEVICTLGTQSTNLLLRSHETMGNMRGKIFEFESRKLVPTYHPSYLLRSPEEKRKAWADLQVVMKLLALPNPR